MIPSLLPVLLEATLRALVAALTVWAGLRLLRVKNLLAQKAAWGLLLIAALTMPLLMRWQLLPTWAAVKLPAASWKRIVDAAPPSAPASSVSARSLSEPETIRQSVAKVADRSPAPAVAVDESQAAKDTEVRTVPVPAPDAQLHASNPAAMGGAGRLLAIGWILYLVVCATLLVRLLWGLASSLRLWIGAKPVEDAAYVGFSPSIRVCWSPQIASPVNIGSGILLPAEYVEWDEEKLRVVLAHERSHIRQRDFYLQLLAGLYTSLTWFSPLGWWLKHKLTELGEAISDRAGLNAASSPSAYAGLLLEFAALPRPTLTGVAMAHSKNLSHRIERLLNDSSFRLAFAGGRRALLTVLVPVALIAATAMVRVQAAPLQQPNGAQVPAAQSADQSPAPEAAQAQAPVTGQSNVTQVTDESSGQASEQAAPAPPQSPQEPAPHAAPSGEPAPAAPPAPPTMTNPGQLPMPPLPAMPPVDVQVRIPPIPPMPDINVMVHVPEGPCMGNGDAYAIVGDPGTKTRFCGDWGDEGAADVDKARSKVHGHFLLFRHEGKLYVIDDPATVNQIEDMHNAVEQQAEQMRALGKQMREAGQAEREAARKAREASREVPVPDLSKEIAALDAAVADLKAHQGGTVTREELAEVQRKVSELQRSLMSAEMKVNIEAMTGEAMKNLYAEQGKFGQQMGQLGREMGRMSIENNKKIGQMIDESLKNGKARPVE
jgi:beta-lactamase regulating signal transducer with metallopeptidase domain